MTKHPPLPLVKEVMQPPLQFSALPTASTMPPMRRSFLPWILLACAPFLACSKTIYVPEGTVVQDDKYDTAFPHVEAAEAFEDILDSIRMINAVANYKHFLCDRESGITPDDLDDEKLEKRAADIDFFQDTASGTATVIHFQSGKLALLTNAHIVHFPDTLVFYFEEDEAGDAQRLVQSIAVKENQQNYIPDIPGADRLDILAIDNDVDVALLGQDVPLLPAGSVSVFNYPLGEAKDLEWGSFVYVVGFPAGTKMITRGLVSKPFRSRNAFVIDATFNRGFSGGLVLAVRDGVPHFEWVGMATASASTTEYRLRPPQDTPPDDIDPRVPYRGDLFLERHRAIRYGITLCIPINAVEAFIEAHAARLAAQGYRLKLFG